MIMMAAVPGGIRMNDWHLRAVARPCGLEISYRQKHGLDGLAAPQTGRQARSGARRPVGALAAGSRPRACVGYRECAEPLGGLEVRSRSL